MLPTLDDGPGGLITRHPNVHSALTLVYEVYEMINELWMILNSVKRTVFPEGPAAMVRDRMPSTLVDQLNRLETVHQSFHSELLVRRGFCIAGYSCIISTIQHAESELEEWRTPLRREALVCQLFCRIFEKAPARLLEYFSLVTCSLTLLREFLGKSTTPEFVKALRQTHYPDLSKMELLCLIETDVARETRLISEIRKRLSCPRGTLKMDIAVLAHHSRSQLRRLMMDANLLRGAGTPNLDKLCSGRMTLLSKRLAVSHLPPCQLLVPSNE